MCDLPELKPVASNSTLQKPFEIGKGNWAIAERAARKIIRKVQPNSVSEERRTKVVDYVQSLIRNCLGAEVFPYGSVPLKTYLPDGDIDLTAFGGAHAEDDLANDIKTLLEEEEKNASSELVVKDVQFVRAEVKLVKCIVQDVVVDISFNQIGGLCTLCFLEQVDRLIGKDHLFKQSIILIKAWCFYESRILGAHYGLISTYALETMVLYIFHLFHSKLHGPLSVLFKFLDYFSKFDWETYIVSLSGPVRLSTLPDMIVEMPDDSDGDLLLQSDFLSSCTNVFSVPSNRGVDKNSRGFQPKHLNIFDPLKELNNLGRSVSKGNFYRIRSAFSYGAKKLSGILSRPSDSIANELRLFFSNTTARGGRRPDVHSICNGSISVSPNPETGDFQPTSGDKSCHDLSSEETKRTSDTANGSARAVGMPYHAPHLYFSRKDRKPDTDKSENSEKVIAECLKSSLDLSGDFRSYLRCLHYGRWWCYETGLGGMHSLPYQNNGPPWDRVLPLMHYENNGFPYPHHNGVHPNPALYGVQPVLLPGVTLGWEEVLKGPKPRGTGLYFPNTNQQFPQEGYNSNNNRSPTGMKGKNHAPLKSGRNNGRHIALFPDPNLTERSSHDGLSQYSPHPNSNGFLIQPEGVVDLDSVEHHVSEKIWRQKPALSSPSRTSPGMQRAQSSLNKEQDRILLGSSYRLKDEDDFPPLPV